MTGVPVPKDLEPYKPLQKTSRSNNQESMGCWTTTPFVTYTSAGNVTAANYYNAADTLKTGGK